MYVQLVDFSGNTTVLGPTSKLRIEQDGATVEMWIGDTNIVTIVGQEDEAEMWGPRGMAVESINFMEVHPDGRF